jgi:hypothetical protein
MLLLFSGMAYMLFHFRPASSTQSDPTQVPVYFKQVEDAMPFPPTLDPATFQRRDFRAAYQVAKDIPGVLAQQP